MLMFMTLKRNGDLKSRGAANASFQRVITNKVDCISPTPDFHALKHVSEVAAKESRYAATVDLSAFSFRLKLAKRTNH